ncbi:hypothetical protein [Polaromonas sp. CG9_12]|nr:hypothetical protein [Polaromonas sp. CG9_12]
MLNPRIFSFLNRSKPSIQHRSDCVENDLFFHGATPKACPFS